MSQTEKDELDMWNGADETALRKRYAERLAQHTCQHYVVVDGKCFACGASVPWSQDDLTRFAFLQ